ncbi:DNA circularization N-terminal domain-containing protein, partial [Asaia astilbis]|uniref:DNA circularization N-terminal domain-containing protein n=1 Tax=Asaia astilbis TaxID=610244 RepID=UPI001E632BB1
MQCSFRGIPFAVMGSGGQAGRNTAVHAYPWRDGVWVEDMGKQGRQYHVSGLLVGPACYAQRDLLVRAAEIEGPGVLVHPTVGLFRVSLMRLEWRERDGMSNVIDLSFDFIEKTDLLGGLVTTALHAAIGVASALLRSSSLSDHRAATAAPFRRG